MTTIALETAKKILQRLRNAGYQAYFVGGCVRDLVMKLPINEVDIATDAPPVVISALFSDTLSIGEAFGIIAVKENGRLFEVATFRSERDYLDGRHPRQIIFSSMKEDALRRDFTINGMYYDPFENRLFDLVEGQRDIKKRVIRAIGHPKLRFSEDKLRILRAIRFASSLNFTIDPKTEKAILKEAPLIPFSVSAERIWQELTKMLKKRPYEALTLLIQLKVLPVIFPELKAIPPTSLKLTATFAKQLNPIHTPEILFLLPFFQGIDEDTTKMAFARLKISNKNMHLIQLWYQVLPHFQKSMNDLVFWAHFLADANAELFLSVFSALQKEPHKQQEFLTRIHSLKSRLMPFITRIQNAQPVVSAKDLMLVGVAPGRLLGDLLKEAEHLSIEYNCQDKEKILSLLKAKGFWK